MSPAREKGQLLTRLALFFCPQPCYTCSMEQKQGPRRQPQALKQSLKEARAAWEKKKSEPDLAEEICLHLINGGALIDLGKLWDVPWSWIAAFMGEGERSKQYQAALIAQNDYFAAWIKSKLVEMGDLDLGELHDPESGKLLPVAEWPENIRKSVIGFEVEEVTRNTSEKTAGEKSELETDETTRVSKVKLESRKGVLELLSKSTGAFVQRHEVTGKLTLEELVGMSRKEEPKEPVKKEEPAT